MGSHRKTGGRLTHAQLLDRPHMPPIATRAPRAIKYVLPPAIVLAALLAAVVPAGAHDVVVPLTDRHWQDAPATVLEEETGIPSSVIENYRLRQREIDPYPSIPGDSGDATNSPDVDHGLSLDRPNGPNRH